MLVNGIVKCLAFSGRTAEVPLYPTLVGPLDDPYSHRTVEMGHYI